MLSFRSYAKWILSGEHSVVRGGKAIAFPLRCFENILTFEESSDFIVIAEEESKSTLISLFEMAAKFSNVPFDEIHGIFKVKSNIPTKAGLGSSAAICVNVAKIFKHLSLCDKVLELAKYLEDKFHKKSSGLDIAVSMKNLPVIFQHNKIVGVLEPTFWPNLVLTYSGEKSSTSACSEVVKKVFEQNENVAYELDNMMNNASDLCESAFINSDFEMLKDGINLGRKVFEGWGLCNDSLNIHIEKLFADGAVAVKPIGSGLGGYVVSLWREYPKDYCDICLTLEKS